MIKMEHKERKILEEEINMAKEKAMNDGNYYLLAHSFGEYLRTLSVKNIPSLLGIAKGWDKEVSILEIAGEELERVLELSNRRLGFYKTIWSYNKDYDEIENCFREGLVYDGIDSIYMVDDMLSAIIYIKSSYKGLRNCIVLSLPKEVTEEELLVDVDVNRVIKEEYLVGFFDYNKKHMDYYSKVVFKGEDE